MKEIIIHIGTHKTGSSSFQEWLSKNPKNLKQAGIHFFNGLSSRSNHAELAECSLRSKIETTNKIMGSFKGFQNLREMIIENIANTVSIVPEKKILFSSENLSLIRTKDECERLASLFPSGVTFTILVVIREKEDFLKSYKNQIVKDGWGISGNPNSAHYIEGDNWLLDFEILISSFEKHFGNIRVFQYKREGLISEMLDFLGISRFSDSDPYLNQSKRFSLIYSVYLNVKRTASQILNKSRPRNKNDG
jgi:hypothetical protein